MSERERRIVTRAALGTLLKRIVYGLVGGVACYYLYCIVMPGSWFLNYTAARVSQTVYAGEAVPIELCRDRKTGSVIAKGTRTFYRSDSVTGPFVDAGRYSFTPDIENSDPCVDRAIQPETFEHSAGYWKFHTDLAFTVNGFDKTTSYDSNVYQIRPQPTTEELKRDYESQIRRLEGMLKRLLQEEAQSGPESQSVPSTESPKSDSTARRETPTTSAPPETPSEPSRPSQSEQQPPSGAARLLEPVTAVTDALLERAGNLIKGRK